MWRRLTRRTTKNFISYAYIPTTRCISTKCLDPLVREFTKAVAIKQPMFQVSPASVRVLAKPSSFYRTLLSMISEAEERIFLSSLYIGGDEAELIEALKRRLRENDRLQVTLLLDLNRSTRPGSDSSARILLPLLREFQSRVHVSMFRSPSLRGILARLVPPRFNEGWGTWHAKVYGADDNVMISGANLNASYFTNRQDRYLLFSGQKDVAQYCFDFMQTAAKFSYQLLPEAPVSSNLPYSYHHGDYWLRWPAPETHPHDFNGLAEDGFNALQKSYRQRMQQRSASTSEKDSESVLLVPIIQAGQFNVREEESIFRQLFEHISKSCASKRPLLNLTSGYFSLYPPYQDLVLKATSVDCQIVAAGPKANGFYGSKGISGRIPEGYTLYEQRFMAAVAKAGRLWRGPSGDESGRGVSLNEWEKPGWTYHAKGIWLSPNFSAPPILTLFGSTNLNARSAHIDTELSFLMIIPSARPSSSAIGSAPVETDDGPTSPKSACWSLRQDLAREVDSIKSNTVDWRGGMRKVRWTTKLIVSLVKGML